MRFAPESSLKQLLFYANTTVTLRGSSGKVCKQADNAYSPRFLDGGVPSFPPRVFEGGCSESMVRLKRDAEIWLTRGQGLVRTVILIKISSAENNRGVIKHSRRFTCQVWHYVGVEGVMRRRAFIHCRTALRLAKTSPELQMPQRYTAVFDSASNFVKGKPGLRLAISWKKI